MGSDDVAKVGSWAGQYGTSERSGASVYVSLRTTDSNESDESDESTENMKPEYTRLGRGPVRTVRRRDPERLAVVGQDAIAR